MINNTKLQQLRDAFGKKASWAVWSKKTKTDKETHLSISSDRSVFDDADLLDTLHNNFVVVGLNPSTEIEALTAHEGDWVNYHAGKNDYKLRHAFMDTPVWGAYMTDFYPNHFAPTEDQLKVDTTDVNDGVLELQRELDMLGGQPVLIALGGEAYKQLTNHFGEDYKIYKISNHGRWAPKEIGIDLWKQEVQAILDDLNK